MTFEKMDKINLNKSIIFFPSAYFFVEEKKETVSTANHIRDKHSAISFSRSFCMSHYNNKEK